MNILSNLKTYGLVGLFFCVLFFTSCVDDSGQAGLELQNPNNKARVFNDSSTVINTYTVQKADSISLDISNLATSMLLGYQVDEKLGIFQNNFMTEVNLASNSVSFGTNPVADSIVMFMYYSGAYGDTNQIQTITVYELNHEDRLHTINNKPMDESVIGQYYNPVPVTTFSYKSSVSDTIRFKFPEAYENKFMDTASYASDSLFRAKILNGFYFVANPITSGGAITSFKYTGATRMVLYYHNTKDTLEYKYDFYSSTHRCNIFKRAYNPQIKYLTMQTPPDQSMEQELFYIKNNNAFEARIDISGLQTWKDSGIFTINKATLSVYVEPNTTDFDQLFSQHLNLQIFSLDKDNKTRTPLVEYNTQQGYAGANLGNLPYGNGYYININTTLYNAIMNGDDVLSLVLTVSSTSNLSTAERTILKGAKNSSQSLKLKITYTKFNAE